MSASGCPNQDQLAQYLLGALPEEEAEQLSEHVSACTTCEVAIETLESLSDPLVKSLRPPPEASVYLKEAQSREALAKAENLGSKDRVEVSGDGGEAPAGRPVGSTSLEHTLLGEYRILKELGRGGMGTVYRAIHTRLDRPVALKVLPPERMADPRAVARFEREMKAVGRLSHPNIVQATDARSIEGRHILVMEYVEGHDLTEVVARRGALRVPDACEAVRQAALGLQYAHEHGLVHRDIKPSNLMLTPQGVVKILDLGLARFQMEADQPEGAGLTAAHQAMGTPDYMAPEQVSDVHSVDIRADAGAKGVGRGRRGACLALVG